MPGRFVQAVLSAALFVVVLFWCGDLPRASAAPSDAAITHALAEIGTAPRLRRLDDAEETKIGGDGNKNGVGNKDGNKNQGTDKAEEAEAGEKGAEDDDEEETEALPSNRLEVKIDEEAIPFHDSDQNDLQLPMLVQEGVTEGSFKCPAPEATEAKDGQQIANAGVDPSTLAGLAVESKGVAMRRLTLRRVVLATKTWSVVDNVRPFFGGWAAQGEEEDKALFITNAQINVERVRSAPDKEGEGAMSVLFADFEEAVTSEPMPIEADSGASITVLYDCVQAGSAVVNLRFKVQNNDGEGDYVCLRWIKECSDGFDGIAIRQGSHSVFTNSAVNADWKALMETEGTHEEVTKFSLVSEGIDRFRPPAVRSDQALLEVDVRGQFQYEDSSIEIREEPIYFSVTYLCRYAGHAHVTLTLARATLNGRSDPKPLQLTWIKHCGDTAYTHLQVFVKSDVFKNKTEAVSKGVAIEGFMRPCKSGSQATAQGQGRPVMMHPPSEREQCNTLDSLLLEVPPKDARTTLELRVDPAGAPEPPAYQNTPDISFDRKVMQVTILQVPKSSSPNLGRHKEGYNPAIRDAVQTMSLKYTCFKDGVSRVTVTLYILAHKPIEFSWKKRCVEPKAKLGKAFTAPQAMVMAVLVLGVVGLVICLVCFICAKEDKSALYGYDPVQRSEHGSVELGGRPGKGKRPEPDGETIGRGVPSYVEQGPQGEVVYH